jgi:nucleotide-binding universal stress UspA family protein
MSEVVPRIERVVVPLDGSRASEAALGPGSALASRLDADLELLIAASRADAAFASAYLHGLEVGSAVKDVRREVATGRSAREAIVPRADDPAQLVCMATHGHTAVGDLVFGSTTEAVLRAVPRPVVLVGPHCRPLQRFASEIRVLGCVDGTGHTLDLGAFVELVRALDASVRLVTVTIESDAIERDPVVHPDRVESLEQLAGELRQREVKADYEILAGHDIWPAINQAAETLPAGLLAVVSHVRTGVDRALGGSEAMTIVRHSRVPVIAHHVP